MGADWWIYDEEDREMPGWRLWRLQGLFKKPPGESLIAGRPYALCRSQQAGAAKWRACMLAPASLSVHEVPTPSAWGSVHKALVAPAPLGLPAEWVRGADPLQVEIDGVLAGMPGEGSGSASQLAGRVARSVDAPRLWGRGASPAAGYGASMGMWARSMLDWTGTVEFEDDAFLAQVQARQMEARFLRAMAGGGDSPAQRWIQMSGELPLGEWRERCEELGSRMQAGEIAPAASGPALKAKRI